MVAPMRLRLRCNAAYSLGHLQMCMVHIPEHVRTVKELASHVSRLLELNLRGGNAEPPQLLLDGFLVCHEDEVREVLRDDEIVDIAPSGASASSDSGTGKRPLALANGEASAKKARQNGTEAAVMAIGWHAPAASRPEAPKAAAKPVAKPATKPVAKAAVEDDDEDSDVDEDDEEAPRAVQVAPKQTAFFDGGRGSGRGRVQGGGRGRGRDEDDASAKAQAIALATCSGPGSGAPAAGYAAPGEADSGRGIFVGGLPPSVDDAALKRHFQMYGAIEEATVMVNPHTGKAKGFGFVEFKDVRSRDKVIADGPTHEIGGKAVEVKPRQGKVAKGTGKDGGKDAGKKGKGSGKDGGKDYGKGGKNGKDGKGGKGGAKGAPAPRVVKQLDDDKDEDDEEDEVAPKAPVAKMPVNAKRKPEAEAEAEIEISSEEAEVQRQMAAMGLPVSFTGGASRGDDDEDEDEEGEEEEEEED